MFCNIVVCCIVEHYTHCASRDSLVSVLANGRAQSCVTGDIRVSFRLDIVEVLQILSYDGDIVECSLQSASYGLQTFWNAILRTEGMGCHFSLTELQSTHSIR